MTSSPRKDEPESTSGITVTAEDLTPPAFYGDTSAVDSMTTIAAPLLVAAAVTVTGVIVQQPDSLRWPGATLLFLVITATLLITSIQLGFWSKRYASTPEQVRQWWLNLNERDLNDRIAADLLSDREPLLRLNNFSRWCYGIGITFLWISIGCAVAPHNTAVQADWRWSTVGLSWFAALVEVLWLAIARAWPLIVARR